MLLHIIVIIPPFIGRAASAAFPLLHLNDVCLYSGLCSVVLSEVLGVNWIQAVALYTENHRQPQRGVGVRAPESAMTGHQELPSNVISLQFSLKCDYSLI